MLVRRVIAQAPRTGCPGIARCAQQRGPFAAGARPTRKCFVQLESQLQGCFTRTARTGEIARLQTSTSTGRSFSRFASSSSAAPAEATSSLQTGARIAAGVGGFFACDYVVKLGMGATGLDVYLPSQIGCMLGAFLGLAGTSLVLPGAAASLQAALMPAVGWVGKWLPVCLVPVQVMLPTIALPGGAAELVKLLLLAGGGWFCSCVITARLVSFGQVLLPFATEAASPPKAAAAAKPLTMRVPLLSLLLFALCMPLGVCEGLGEQFKLGLTDDGARAARMVSFVAMGLGSYALALKSGLPGHISFLVSGASVIAGVGATAYARGETYSAVAKRDYIAGNSKPWSERGAGDALLWFLGPALAATGVQIFQYRARILTYGPVLLGTCAIMSLTNIVGTALAGPLLDVSPEALLAAFVRCVTIPMAVPTYEVICETDGVAGNVALVALCAGVSGFMGFGLSKMVLNSALGAAPITNPVARGIATGTSGHVLGAATFAATEPEAFVWGMLSMAAAGVCSSAWICACPPVRDLVIRLARRNENASSEREHLDVHAKAVMPHTMGASL